MRRPSTLRRLGTSVARFAALAIGTLSLALLINACSGATHTAIDEFPPPSASATTATAPIALSVAYRSAVTGSVAVAMKLNTARVTAALASQPNSTLMTIAKPMGLAQDTLAAAIRAALSSVTRSQVLSGAWTPIQAAEVTTFWNTQIDPSLITLISQWFRVG